jgi:hypothetical protein
MADEQVEKAGSEDYAFYRESGPSLYRVDLDSHLVESFRSAGAYVSIDESPMMIEMECTHITEEEATMLQSEIVKAVDDDNPGGEEKKNDDDEEEEDEALKEAKKEEKA